MTSPADDDPLDDRRLGALVDDILTDMLAAPNRKVAASAWIDTLCIEVLPDWLNTPRQRAATGTLWPVLEYLRLVEAGDDARAEAYLKNVHTVESQTGMPYWVAAWYTTKGASTP